LSDGPGETARGETAIGALLERLAVDPVSINIIRLEIR